MKINILAEMSEGKVTLDEAVEMQKLSMLNNMVYTLSSSVCNHHQVF